MHVCIQYILLLWWRIIVGQPNAFECSRSVNADCYMNGWTKGRGELQLDNCNKKKKNQTNKRTNHSFSCLFVCSYISSVRRKSDEWNYTGIIVIICSASVRIAGGEYIEMWTLTRSNQQRIMQHTRALCILSQVFRWPEIYLSWSAWILNYNWYVWSAFVCAAFHSLN